MTLQLHSSSDAQTRAIGSRLGAALRAGDVVALNGPLGAGKTCLVGGIAHGLRIDPAQVSSPTFVLCQEYGDDRSPCLVHIDAYRIAGAADLDSIGFDELLRGDRHVLVIEWAERITGALPRERIEVCIQHIGPSDRSLVISGPSRVLDRLSGESGCPICGRAVPVASVCEPFCSDRCRYADLGRWFAGSYRVTRPIEHDDLDG